MCTSCIPLTLRQYCNVKCWYFAIAIFVSLVLMICSIIGMMGHFDKRIDICYFTGLLGTVFGVWLPTPNMKKDKEATPILV